MINEKERESCSVLTIDEENQIVDHLKNKNRALQGMGRFELTRLIIHVLKVRKYGLKKFHGRKFTSIHAKNVLQRGLLSRSFWKSVMKLCLFFIRYAMIIHIN